MPYEISVKCPSCGSGVYWIVDDGETRLETGGCRGGGCQEVYEGLLRELTRDEAAERREELGV